MEEMVPNMPAHREMQELSNPSRIKPQVYAPESVYNHAVSRLSVGAYGVTDSWFFLDIGLALSR